VALVLKPRNNSGARLAALQTSPSPWPAAGEELGFTGRGAEGAEITWNFIVPTSARSVPLRFNSDGFASVARWQRFAERATSSLAMTCRHRYFSHAGMHSPAVGSQYHGDEGGGGQA